MNSLPEQQRIYRYTQHLQCSIRECADVVAVLGHAEIDPNDPLGPYGYVYDLFPLAMHRPLQIIEIPYETPQSVRDEITAACALFWMNPGSCANKLRISVERALDELGIAPAGTLNQRIAMFEQIDPGNAQTFHALREVGNVASHEGNNERETVLDAFELYEDALRNIFGRHHDRIEELRTRIRASRGR